MIIFTFDNDVRGLFDGNRLVDHQADNRRLTMGEMTLEGSAGTLRLNGNADLFFRAHGSNQEQRVHYVWHDRDFGGDCVYRLQSHVVEHFTDASPLTNTSREYIQNLRIVEAVYRSAASGSRILL